MRKSVTHLARLPVIHRHRPCVDLPGYPSIKMQIMRSRVELHSKPQAAGREQHSITACSSQMMLRLIVSPQIVSVAVSAVFKVLQGQVALLTWEFRENLYTPVRSCAPLTDPAEPNYTCTCPPNLCLWTQLVCKVSVLRALTQAPNEGWRGCMC